MRKKLLISSIFALTCFLILPTLAQASPKYVFPVQGCPAHYGHYHHDYPATDILAKVGCKFVATTSGIVNEVNTVDKFSWKTNLGSQRGGKFVSIVGDDGVRYYGSHLRTVASGIKVGTHVTAGQLLGYLGTSGDAKGLAPHVHYGISWPTKAGIWWVRRGEVYPWRYLDAWRAGKDLSPAKAVASLRAKKGEIPKHTGY